MRKMHKKITALGEIAPGMSFKWMKYLGSRYVLLPIATVALIATGFSIGYVMKVPEPVLITEVPLVQPVIEEELPQSELNSISASRLTLPIGQETDKPFSSLEKQTQTVTEYLTKTFGESKDSIWVKGDLSVYFGPSIGVAGHISWFASQDKANPATMITSGGVFIPAYKNIYIEKTDLQTNNEVFQNTRVYFETNVVSFITSSDADITEYVDVLVALVGVKEAINIWTVDGIELNKKIDLSNTFSLIVPETFLQIEDKVGYSRIQLGDFFGSNIIVSKQLHGADIDAVALQVKSELSTLFAYELNNASIQLTFNLEENATWLKCRAKYLEFKSDAGDIIAYLVYDYRSDSYVLTAALAQDQKYIRCVQWLNTVMSFTFL